MNLFSRTFGQMMASVKRSLGWQSAMFGDVMDGASGNSSPDLVRPYAKSAWVRSAIKFVAGPISMRPLIITSDRRGGDVVVDNPDLTRFWETPARTAAGKMTRQNLIEAIVGLVKLKGQAFLIMDDSWDMPRGKKAPLILARADAMHAIVDRGELIGWTYTDAQKTRSALIPEQVIPIKSWNPYDEILGLSEWEAAMIAAQSDYAAGTFARNLAMNNGDRGPFVIGKGGTFTDEQIKQVTAQLRMKRELGRRGEFRAAFLPADVTVQDPSLNAVDAAYVAQRLENRKEVYIALGVPPSFADPQASYSIGSASDRFRLIEDECMPLAAKIADAFEIVSARFMGAGQTVFVEFDWDSHSTMQQVRSERFETATKAVDRGMPWMVAGEYFRLKLPRFKGDDVGRLPFNLVEVESPESRDQRPEEEEDVDPVGELEQLFARSCCTAHAASVQDGSTPKAPSAKAVAAWQRVRKYREPWERKFAQKVSRYLMDARSETLRKIAAVPATEKAVRVPDVLSLIFDLDAWLADWIKGLLATSRAAIEQAGIEVWSDELRRDDPMTQPAAEVIEALNIRENRLSGAGQKVWEAVRDELQAGIDAGDTMDQLAERTRRKFRGIDKSRSMAIAKTETTVAYEFARDLAFRAAGVQYKQWLTSGLGNERLSHLAANEQIVPMDEKFIVGGFEMSYPGDPDAPAKEVINCNCVTIAVADPADADDFDNDDTIPY